MIQLSISGVRAPLHPRRVRRIAAVGIAAFPLGWGLFAAGEHATSLRAMGVALQLGTSAIRLPAFFAARRLREPPAEET